MIWNVFKRHRPATVPHASHASITAQANKDKRMDLIIAEVRQHIDGATTNGDYGVVYEHMLPLHVSAELVRRLRQQGYVAQQSHDPLGTYIAWLPLDDKKDPP